MIGIGDHLEGNGDHQGIVGVHREGSGVDEAEVVVVEEEVTEMVDEMVGEMVDGMEEGEEHHLGVLRLTVLFLWKQERLNIHSGISDQCNSKVLVPWPRK